MKRGHITIFLSMILVLVCAILFTSLEAARTAASAAYFKMVAQASVVSGFGEYYRPLWEEYRILAFYEKEDLASRICAYMEDYQQEGTDSFLGFQKMDVLTTRSESLADLEGAHIQKSGADYMKYHLVGDAAENLLEEFQILDQIKKAAGFAKGLLTFSESVLKLEEQISRIVSKTQILIQALEEGKRTAAELYQRWEGMKEEGGEGEIYELVKKTAEELKLAVIVTGTEWQGLLKELEIFDQQAVALGERLKETLAAFENGGYQGAIRGLLKEQLDHIQTYSSLGGSRYQELKEWQKKLQERVVWLEDVISLPEKIQAVSLEEAEELLKHWCENAIEVTLLEWMDNLKTDGGEEETVETELSLKIWTEKSLLAWVLGEDAQISDVELSKEQNVMWKGAEEKESGSLSQSMETILFREYLMETFANYQEHRNHYLKYELEYLLAGNESDRENLLETVWELFLLREGIRFLELLSDEAKMLEAEGAALMFVGVSGSPLLVQVVKIGILAVWAANDAAEDVRMLMQGERVPLIALFGQKWIMLDYMGYLRVLLAFEGTEVLRKRCANLIHATMQIAEPEFDLAKCIYCADVEIRAEGNHVFSTVPFLKQFDGVEIKSGKFCVNTQFSYHS